ncbi:replication-relaxation family protein [Nakamurella sp. PAMC28650]|uniref:replication-relaxation family protein n=1 Tax=Nakamurella sp. PAMC28650 TaxID=2762325 RepID=UPI00164D699C|nr:replication-relaxation family protein [Nakamurella sp. PAMC28650]QNK82566.1 replication-relaxation family protein [Nakamurella sp. PAMC28650]
MSTYLSSRDHAVIDSINRLRHISSQQLQRLHFVESLEGKNSKDVTTRRVLARLVGEGYVSRIERSSGSGFVYQPAGAKTRNIDLHQLDVSELYVLLSEAEARGECSLLEFTPEEPRGGVKADAYIRLDLKNGKYSCFAEIDRATEYKPQLMKKLRAYSQAYDRATSPFPKVLWIVSFAPRDRYSERVNIIKQLVSREPEPELFDVLTLQDAVTQLLNS